MFSPTLSPKLQDGGFPLLCDALTERTALSPRVPVSPSHCKRQKGAHQRIVRQVASFIQTATIVPLFCLPAASAQQLAARALLSALNSVCKRPCFFPTLTMVRLVQCTNPCSPCAHLPEERAAQRASAGERGVHGIVDQDEPGVPKAGDIAVSRNLACRPGCRGGQARQTGLVGMHMGGAMSQHPTAARLPAAQPTTCLDAHQACSTGSLAMLHAHLLPAVLLRNEQAQPNQVGPPNQTSLPPTQPLTKLLQHQRLAQLGRHLAVRIDPLLAKVGAQGDTTPLQGSGWDG